MQNFNNRCPRCNNDCRSPHNQAMDCGPDPFVLNINQCILKNKNFRAALWTGEHLQLTAMCIPVSEDIGVENHECLDQFIYVVEGFALVKMGNCENNFDFQKQMCAGCAAIIPAGTWHNIVNIGDAPLKLYSIYAPVQHPKGTIHQTKMDAQKAEKEY